ncbi:MAG: prenyltransferase/squalene oxidase repeat-containing protein [Peptococcaceae bacterium]
MRVINKRIALLLMLVLLLGSGGTIRAATEQALNAALGDTADYIYQTVKKTQVGSSGGEWAVLGLARSDYDAPEQYYRDYYGTVEAYVRACKGVLHNKKYTEYSRLTVVLTSIGKDPRNVAGYNLLQPLGDFEKTVWQGINGPVWALIALDSGGYPMPQNPAAVVQATRDMYVDEILSRQLADGGFSLFGGTGYDTPRDMVSDPDITGMALQALAKYRHRADVKKVTEEALACLAKLQNDDGGFASWGSTNSESCVQVIVALCELGVPLDDPRFVKNGHTLLENLLTFHIPGKGFLHTADGGGSNQMATEQGFYGLVAAKRAATGQNSLYRMTDVLKIPDAVSEGSQPARGMPGKHPNI